MNIGFVSSWLERGATYVTINYIKLLQPNYKCFVYARGGEYFDEALTMEDVKIHQGYRLEGTEINKNDFIKWIKRNKLDIVILNEQDSLASLCAARSACKDVIFGAYIDYYKESTVKNFGTYDFLICNTKRHASVFSWHKQCLYMPWGVDTNLYCPKSDSSINNQTVFFHSMGMSNRKGTETLIKVFTSNEELYKKSRLIIHTQIDISNLINEHDASRHNVEIIKKTVSAPGLYSLGDVYVYPTKLDGLGLTIYEALSSGLPVIATNVAPINEIINNDIGKLVDVKYSYSRSDGYYWPLSVVDEDSLYKAMLYYVKNSENLLEFKNNARKFAVESLDIYSKRHMLQSFLTTVKRIENDDICKAITKASKNQRKSDTNHFLVSLLPQRIESLIRKRIEKRRRAND